MEFAPIEQQIKGQILFFQQLVDVLKVVTSASNRNRECGRALVVILVINRSQITKNATLGLEGTFLFSFFY